MEENEENNGKNLRRADNCEFEWFKEWMKFRYF